MALRGGGPSYSTFVPQEELERPQRDALQRAMAVMTPPGLVQQGQMLREHFSSLGPVRAAERTADDLTSLFGRLGPIGLGDVANPVRLGARAGEAAARAVQGAGGEPPGPGPSLREELSGVERLSRERIRGTSTLAPGVDLSQPGGTSIPPYQERPSESQPVDVAAQVRAETGQELVSPGVQGVADWARANPALRTVGGAARALSDRAGAFLEEQRQATRELEARKLAGDEMLLNLTPQGRALTGEERERELRNLRFYREAGESGGTVAPVGRGVSGARAALSARGNARDAAGELIQQRAARQQHLESIQRQAGIVPEAATAGGPPRPGQRAALASSTEAGASGAGGEAVSLYGPRGEVLRNVEAPRVRRLGDTPEPVDPATLRPYQPRTPFPERPTAPAAEAPPAGAARSGWRLPTWGEAADVATSMPLLTPASQATNLLGGAFRTFQRFAEDSAGAFWTDRAVRESLADFAGMVTELPGALRDVRGSITRGGSAAARRQMGATGESLTARPGAGPLVATLGTRLNAAGDDFWRRLNTAGASARAAARGITDPDDVADLGGQAADFVSFTGKNSSLAEFLGGFRQRLDDPAATGGEKAFASLMVGLTPYVRTPERILKSSLSLMSDPVVLPLQRAFGKGRLGEALRAGDAEAKREFAGRVTVGTMTLGLAGLAYASGNLYGAPPRDAKLRRELEADGARWNTLYGVPLNKLGSFGQAMAGVGTVLQDARLAAEKGVDPSDLVRTGISSAMRWSLGESYLREVERFASDIAEGRGAEAAERLAINVAGRPAAAVAGAVGAFDPVEREVRGTGAELLNRVPGGRFALPERIDPATGRPVERAGSGVGRLFFGAQGTAYSAEAKELARLGVTAREFKPQDTVYGNVQTPQARRVLQETYGRLAGQYVRDTMARPEYRGATEEVQAATLERQLALAARVADLEVGDRVARDPQARFELEWARTPQYRGVEGTPDRIARQNLEIREAKQLLSAYQQRYGETRGRYRFYDEHPDLIDFARRPEVPARSLADAKEAVRRRTGAPDTRDAALLGAGDRVLASAPFVAPEESPAWAAAQQRRAQEQFDVQREIESLIARARSGAPTGGGGGFQFTAP